MTGIPSKEATADSSPDNGIETSSFQQDGLRKPEIEHTETLQAQFSQSETKRLLRKIDRTLLPLLSLLYLLSFLDRANIGNARLAGLEKDLNMTGKWDYAVSSPQYHVSCQVSHECTDIEVNRLQSRSSSHSTWHRKSRPTWP